MARGKNNKETGLKDIAKSAGVSTMTASRALRGIEGVSEKKRKEIQSVARKLGYRPNSNARSLATTQSDLIGISIPTLFNNVFSEIIDGMRQTFQQAGYASVIDTTEYDPKAELAWVERMLSWRPAGLILTGTTHSSELQEALKGTKVPIIEIWDTTNTPIDTCVGIDHFSAGQRAADHALSLGYKSPAFVGVPEGRDPRADARLSGIQSRFALSQPGQSVHIARIMDRNNFVVGHSGTLDLFEQANPDIIFYLNDHVAFGGMTACAKLSKSVPDNVGIFGFNSLDLAHVLEPSLTTIRTPRRMMGLTAARNLLARIHGAKTERVTVLPVELVEGQTTRLQQS
ncbi:LacI family transcription regulator [Roseibium sp. TrichSKD4]|uniref:LacI family DNA-binding transcriptional regulator n=1 Tax=Roseibium sp. TrichSKD4 TaxID=744980 RepID=UPI0001E56F1F|nr:LacI family DNA-binding transcriptional regulator [Roseibium sp. TrichSKD4]EFO32075.1 LacI family transcription regulator [Roseibium sp. TrichSKD4]